MSNNYFSEEFLDRVKYNNDLLDLVSEYTALKKRGKNHMGLCPFHSEDTPSFSVDVDKQLYYCFGCGAGGNIFNFIMQAEGLDFIEAVEYLTDRANLELPEEDLSPQQKRKRSKKQKLYEVHKLAVQFYKYLLTENEIGDKAYDYLYQRDFSPEIINKFKLGFAPDRWDQLYKFLQKKGYSDQILSQSGLVIERNNASGYYDRFRNRVLFSIFNHRGQAIGFGGRVLSEAEEPKYLNSPETLIFDKSRNLYGLNLAKASIRDTEEAIIMEGYTDVLRAYQVGIKNAVASLGTSLTKQQAELLNRYAQKVYIAYDADAAGEEATLRGLDILRNIGLRVEVVQLPANQDPDDFIAQHGKEGFEDLLNQALPLVEFKINRIINDQKVESVEDKVSAVKQILPILTKIEGEIEKDEYLEEVARRLEINFSALQREYNKFKRQQERTTNQSQSTDSDSFTELKEELNSSSSSGYTNAIEKLLKMAINHPEYVPRIKDKLPLDRFIDEHYRPLVESVYDLHTQEGQVTSENLMSKLNSEQLRNLVAKLSVEEEVSSDRERELKDCIKRIKEYKLTMELEDLDKQIKQAEAEDNYDRWRELLQQKQELIQLREEG